MGTLFSIGNKISFSSFENAEYAPVDGNEFEWPVGSNVFYKVIVKKYENGSKLAWIDRNLGATQVATSSTDTAAYGDLYQWGRGTDGHEKRTSGTTSTLSTTDQPGHGDFITTSINPLDWRSPRNDNLWQGVDGVNNPSPPGWRIPTQTEWEMERQSWDSNDSAGAFNSELKLTLTGFRIGSDGSFLLVNQTGYYWSSITSGGQAIHIRIESNNSNILGFTRVSGFAIRCVRDIN